MIGHGQQRRRLPGRGGLLARREECPQERTGGVDIGGGCEGEFGGTVRRVCRAFVRREQPTHAEIGQHDRIGLAAQQDIVRMEVAVDNTGLVCRHQGVENLGQEGGGAARVDGVTLGQQTSEVTPRDIFAGDERGVPGGTVIVDRRDLLRSQRRCAARHGIEPRDPIRVAAMLVAEEFDHDPLPEHAITREMDTRPFAPAEALEQFVLGQQIGGVGAVGSGSQAHRAFSTTTTSVAILARIVRSSWPVTSRSAEYGERTGTYLE